jgi:uncharacterized OsmC-like protein
MVVDGPATPEEYEDIRRKVEATCPVADTLVNGAVVSCELAAP